MKRLIFLSVLIFCVGFTSQAQVSSFKLENGLTVIINEDHRSPSIFGSFVVKAGSVDDPTDATGLAHYLEHVMFKGSQNVGTYDWEKEKPHYENIIALYDELAKVPEEQREEIQKKINEESLLAAQYTINNEYSNLIQAIGGTGLNAGTGHDLTYFHNEFPSAQLKRWLMLNADRFECPVFRGFQSELETVYEEKNMYSDNAFQMLSQELLKNVFNEENPYARPIVGLTEHLKTPSLRRLIEFYNNYYVPSNMAVILSGDVNVEEAKVLIEETLGKWKNVTPAKRTEVKYEPISEKKTVKMKITPIPLLAMGYEGIQMNSEDKYITEIMSGILMNSNSTGLLDKLRLDGDVLSVGFSSNTFRQGGMFAITAIPVFDMKNGAFEPLSKVEKLLIGVLENLKKGKIDDWLLKSVKDQLIMDFELSKESNYATGLNLVYAFGYDEKIEDLDKYAEQIKSVTKEDVISIANKYLGKPYVAINSLQGSAKKDKLEKPEYKPLVTATGKTSAFAQKVKEVEVNIPEFKPIDFSEITIDDFVPGVKLLYAQNPDNDIFSLTIKYGVGTIAIPELEYSVNLMNNAGVLSQYTAYELKREFSKLGCTIRFSCSDNSTLVTLRGKEESLAKACVLLSKVSLMPSLDSKQMNSLLGNEVSQRGSFEKNDKDTQSGALSQYIQYGKKSSYIDRLPVETISRFTVSNLAASYIEATKYEASIHYSGMMPYQKVKKILTENLAFPSNLKAKRLTDATPMMKYDENTVFLVNNKDARQADVYLYIQGKEFSTDQQSGIDAFNEYFGGGFNGVLLQELREKRSLAYTASAGYYTPSLPKMMSRFGGYIGTQGDKTLDAVDEFTKIIKDMPLHPDRIGNLKDYLKLATLSSTPSVRYKTQIIENWMNRGYTEDPRIKLSQEYAKLTFDDITRFYEENIKNKPIAIGIIVNTKQIDTKQLEKFGKVVKLSTTDLFK